MCCHHAIGDNLSYLYISIQRNSEFLHRTFISPVLFEGCSGSSILRLYYGCIVCSRFAVVPILLPAVHNANEPTLDEMMKNISHVNKYERLNVFAKLRLDMHIASPSCIEPIAAGITVHSQRNLWCCRFDPPAHISFALSRLRKGTTRLLARVTSGQSCPPPRGLARARARLTRRRGQRSEPGELEHD